MFDGACEDSSDSSKFEDARLALGVGSSDEAVKKLLAEEISSAGINTCR